MRKFWHIACLLLCSLIVTSCGDDDEEVIEVDEVWKAQNEEAWNTQLLVPDFEKLSSQSNAGFILYKVLKTGDSKEQIYYTSTVECYYKGTFVDGTVFDDRSFESGSPAVFLASEVVDGFSTALQHMHPGDRWLIWIPQQMGYGAAGSNLGLVTIKPYTTLIFDLEVTKIIQQ